MKIKNFVNFLTMRINKDVVDKALEDDEELLDGSDLSTLDVTKAYWLLYVAEQMKENNQDIDTDWLKRKIGKNDSLSKDGYNLLQQDIIVNSSNEDYDGSMIKSVLDDNIISKTLSDIDTVNLIKYMVDKRMVKALISFKDNIKTKNFFEKENMYKDSAFISAVSMYIRNPNSNKTKEIFNTVLDIIKTNETPKEKHNQDGEMHIEIKNDISNILVSADIDSVIDLFAINKFFKILEATDLSGYAGLEVKEVTGLGDNSITYDSYGSFPGYGYAHYLVESKKEDMLDALKTNKDFQKSFFSLPSTDKMESAGKKDGLSLASLLCGNLKIKEGEWNCPKNMLADLNVSDLDLYAKYGTVRSIANVSLNLYGVVNLVLLEFLSYHTKLYNNSDKSKSPDDMDGITDKFSQLMKSLFVSLSYDFYVEWRTFFNKDIL